MATRAGIAWISTNLLDAQRVRQVHNHLPEALTVGVSYIVGSIFPLIAYFFLPIPIALPVSLVLTVIALIAVGVIRGRLASINLVVSSLEIVAVGAASALGGYLLGTLIPRTFGF